ncbi:TolC family protein [Pontiella agarivorans]|uniref:TolC family protein n=1 Tax=Pontiella agarivorans TaxID=3038953 RepID=A0ABU5MXK4_9BACT|nr:TolC family protein [Pontiella agarivorans]MDZ8118925.1 TolC family protein [Pontiella agarivorans]
MKKIWILTAMLAAAGTYGQTNTLLTWEQCLEKAKAHNPDLVSARAAIRELEYGVTSASSGFLPSISARASGTYGQNENSDDWSDTKNSSGTLSLDQDLFSGGGNVARRGRALAQLEIGKEQYRKILSDVEFALRSAYLDVIYAQELIKLTEQIEERRAANVRLIQLRFDGGRENAGSLARTKAQYSQAAYESKEAQRELVYALRNLAAAIGLMKPVDGAAGDLSALSPEELADLEGLMKQTPDYAIAVTQVEAAGQGLKVTRSSRFPQVSFSASAGLGDGSGFERYDANWRIGLSASVPLFTGGQLRSDIAAAKEQIIQTEMDLIDTGNSLMVTLQQRWNDYVNAVENEAVQNELFRAEQLRAEISTAKYKQGLLSYEDWDTIESNLITQGKTHLQRRRAAARAEAGWKNALGLSVWQTIEKGE